MCFRSQHAGVVQGVRKIRALLHIGGKLRVLRKPVPKRVRLIFSGELVLPLFTLFSQIGCLLNRGPIPKGALQHPLDFGARLVHRRVRLDQRSYPRRTP